MTLSQMHMAQLYLTSDKSYSNNFPHFPSFIIKMVSLKYAGMLASITKLVSYPQSFYSI